MQNITGQDAIEYAREHGLTLNKYADPTEDARQGLTADEAEEIAREDPSLIYIAAPPRRELQIEIAVDTPEADEFVAWLRRNGHDARIGNDTGNYVNGKRADIGDLWDDYCNEIPE